jgi:hypothetical protein
VCGDFENQKPDFEKSKTRHDEKNEVGSVGHFGKKAKDTSTLTNSSSVIGAVGWLLLSIIRNSVSICLTVQPH